MTDRELLSEEQYRCCFERAFRRMAIVLNYSKNLCPLEWLALTDEDIETQFKAKVPSSTVGNTYEKLLLRLRFEGDAPAASYDDDDTAENFFYGRFDFAPEHSPPRIRIVPILQEAFVEWSREKLHFPPYQIAELGVSETEAASPQFMSSCATNYLLKNFWHNYVHNKMQGITHENYMDFGGMARYEADFEADNLANLFLIYSYGLPLCAFGMANNEIRKEIVRLLRRNRCNTVFAYRAAVRDEAPNQEERDWRYRRTLSSYISGWTAALGYAVVSLAVYLNDRVIVSMNGLRIRAKVAPYFGRDTKLRHAHFQQVAVDVTSSYVSRMLENQSLASFATQSLSATLKRAEFEPTDDLMSSPDDRPEETGIQFIV